MHTAAEATLALWVWKENCRYIRETLHVCFMKYTFSFPDIKGHSLSFLLISRFPPLILISSCYFHVSFWFVFHVSFCFSFIRPRDLTPFDASLTHSFAYEWKEPMAMRDISRWSGKLCVSICYACYACGCVDVTQATWIFWGCGLYFCAAQTNCQLGATQVAFLNTRVKLLFL